MALHRRGFCTVPCSTRGCLSMLMMQPSLNMQEAPNKQPRLGTRAAVLPDFSYLESPEARNVAIQFYSRSSTLRSAEKKVKVCP